MQIFDSYKLFFVISYNISNKCTCNALFNLYINNISKNYYSLTAANKKQRLSCYRNNR
jgi:hypothetical protein